MNGEWTKERRERVGALFRTHGLSKTPEYKIWVAIIYRTENPKCHAYPLYGGRGIKMCKRWRDNYAHFLADMGRRPSLQHSVERINNDGLYSPDNCRWALAKEQTRNARFNRWITFNGRTMILTDWAKEIGIGHNSLAERIDDLKWPLEKALTKPSRWAK
ncbi:MAG TPA: hypothetical protein VFU31_24795 [Candidatus Binatia bacterium]|nr:hypothetical protein [Candidatus Binatia bacterium]